MLVIAAYFTCLPKAETRFLAEIQKLVEETRKEAGCISFSLFASKETPLAYMLFEEWESAEALEHHKTLPHYTGFIRQGEQLFSDKRVKKYHISEQ